MTTVVNNWVTTFATGEDTPHGLISDGTSVFVTTNTTPAKLLKVNPATGTYTTLNFPSDGKHNQAFDLIYETGSGKLLVPFYNASGTANKVVVSAVTPSSLAYTDVVDATVSDFTGGLNSICSDGTYIYLAALNGVHRYDLATFTSHTYLNISGGSLGHCIRYDSVAIYYTTASSPGRLFRINQGTFTVEDFDSGAFTNVITDDIAFTDDHVWVGLETGAYAGQIFKVRKDDLTSYELVPTGITSQCWAVYYRAPYIYAAFNTTPGTVLRINPETLAAETFTFPTGQDSVNEITNVGSKLYFTFYTAPGQLSSSPIAMINKVTAFKFRSAPAPLPPPTSGSYAEKLAAAGVISGFAFDTAANVFATEVAGLPVQPMSYAWGTGPCDAANPGGLGNGTITFARSAGQRLCLATSQHGVCYFPTIDNTIYHSAGGGTGSLKVTIPSNSDASTGGYVWLPYQGLGSSVSIGPDHANGGIVYLQWYQRWSSTFITAIVDSGELNFTGTKQAIHFSTPPGNDSSYFSVVSIVGIPNGLFSMYGQQGADSYSMPAPGEQIYLQPAALCLYINGGVYGDYLPPCIVVEADRWYECTYALQLRPVDSNFTISGTTLTRAGTFPTALSVSDPNHASIATFPGVDVYIVGDGYYQVMAWINTGSVTLNAAPVSQGSGKTVYIANYANNRMRSWVDGVACMDYPYAKVWWGPHGEGPGFGSIKILPQMTNKSAAIAHADAYVWYDDFVISTSPISMTGPTLLEQLASSMSTGTWAELTSTGADAALIGAGGSGITTPYAVNVEWDSVRKRLHFIGEDHVITPPGFFHLQYDAITNSWPPRGRPDWYLNPTGDGHGYHMLAINVATRQLIRQPYGSNVFYAFNLDTDDTTNPANWSTLTTLPIGSYIINCIQYFPERNSLLFLLGGTGGLAEYSFATATWADLFPGTGIISTWTWMVYNPVKHEILIGEGTDQTPTGTSTNELWVYSSAGVLTQKNNVPSTYRTFDGGGFNGVWTADPVTGKYLVLTDPTIGTGHNLYTYDSVTDTYGTPSAQLPAKHLNGNFVVTPMIDLGVTLWVYADRTTTPLGGILLYKY